MALAGSGTALGGLSLPLPTCNVPIIRSSLTIIPSLQLIMSTFSSTSNSQSNFVSIFNAALESYKRKTKKDLASHPLLPTIQSCDSAEAILTVLRGQIPAFNQFQNGDDGFTKWVAPTVNVLYSFSATLGQGVGLVNIMTFPCEELLLLHLLSGVHTCKSDLCGDRRSSFGRCPSSFSCAANSNTHGTQAAKDAGSSKEKLVELFIRIERFFGRLEIYTSLTPTTAMNDITIEVMVEVLMILGIATKEVKRGGLSELMWG